MRTSSTPAAPGTAVTLRHIAVGIDGSPPAERAFDFAADLARRYGAELSVVSVAPLTGYETVEPDAAWLPRQVLDEEVRSHRTLVDRATERARATGVDRVRGAVLEGRVPDELVAYAEQRAVDLFVLGSRGLSAAGRLLLGSTSNEVAHRLSCPLLIVREAPRRPA
jgi:nucleotide-binding universal stress UspA family protein